MNQQGQAQQDIRYTYYANGNIQSSFDAATHTLARYGYDNAGLRVFESYAAASLQKDSQGQDQFVTSEYFQADAIAYDELGRMSRVSDTHPETAGTGIKTHDVRYEYDAVGNRRAVRALYWDPVSQAMAKNEHMWYRYDAANRFVVSQGSLTRRGDSMGDSSGQIVLDAQNSPEGVQLEYDLAGQRKAATYARDGHREDFGYSADGYLETIRITGGNFSGTRVTRRLDALGRTIQSLESDGDHELRQSKTTQYDKDNRVLKEEQRHLIETDGNIKWQNDQTVYSYYQSLALGGDNLAKANARGAGALAKTVSKSWSDDAPTQITTNTKTNSYQYWDSAKQSSITTDTVLPDGRRSSASTQMGYDVNGHLAQASVPDGDQGTRTLRYRYQPSLQFQLAGLGTDAPGDGGARGAAGTFAQSMAERAAMLDPYGFRNMRGPEVLPPVVVTGKRVREPAESPVIEEFLTSERIDTRFAAVTPTGMTKLDGSQVTYSFNRGTGDVYWNLGEADTVRLIPKAFITPTVEDFKNAPSNPFRGLDTAVTDFMKLGVGGGLTLATGGLFLRGAMAVNAEVGAWGGWLGGGVRGAAMGNAANLSELSVVGTEATLGVVTNTVAPSVVLTGLVANRAERMTGGLRNPANLLLDDAQMGRLTREFSEIGGNPSILRFNRGGQTSYVDDLDIINVRGDVLPIEGAAHPRSSMSTRSVLAHELGHRAHQGTGVAPGAWNDEFRASYWAAKNTPNLSEMERVDLLNDAMLRAREAGVPIKLNKFMQQTLYGY